MWRIGKEYRLEYAGKMKREQAHFGIWGKEMTRITSTVNSWGNYPGIDPGIDLRQLIGVIFITNGSIGGRRAEMLQLLEEDLRTLAMLGRLGFIFLQKTLLRFRTLFFCRRTGNFFGLTRKHAIFFPPLFACIQICLELFALSLSLFTLFS